MNERRSPPVSGFSWGRVQVEGEGVFKDAKLYPGGAREWDWRETGTRHAPGVQPADVAELLDHGATVIVLSKGVQNRLRVPAATVAWLEDRGARVIVLGSREAVERYNDLAAREPAAALIHSTC